MYLDADDNILEFIDKKQIPQDSFDIKMAYLYKIDLLGRIKYQKLV